MDTWIWLVVVVSLLAITIAVLGLYQQFADLNQTVVRIDTELAGLTDDRVRASSNGE